MATTGSYALIENRFLATTASGTLFLAKLDRRAPNHKLSKCHGFPEVDHIECMIMVRMREPQTRRSLRCPGSLTHFDIGCRRKMASRVQQYLDGVAQLHPGGVISLVSAIVFGIAGGRRPDAFNTT